MFNPNPNQRKNQITNLCERISKWVANGILRMLAVLLSSTQATTKGTTKLKDTHGKNRLEKSVKNVFYCYFKSNPKKRGYSQRMIEIWVESAKFKTTSQRLANQARMTLNRSPTIHRSSHPQGKQNEEEKCSLAMVWINNQMANDMVPQI